MSDKLSTGDIIYLGVVGEDLNAEFNSYVHAEGFSDTRIGTADAYDGPMRAYNFRECLFEVTNQLQYGAQKELTEHKNNYLSCIYSSIKEARTQCKVMAALIDELSMHDNRREKLVEQKESVESYLKYAITMSIEQAGEFEDGGHNIKEENRKASEVKKQVAMNKGWSSLVGGFKPGQLRAKTFPDALGPFGLKPLKLSDLPQYNLEDNGDGKLITMLYGPGKEPQGWANFAGADTKCICKCSSLDKVTLPPVVRKQLYIPNEAKTFVWVYPCEGLKELNDQSKIAFAQQGAQQSLLVFGGYAYLSISLDHHFPSLGHFHGASANPICSVNAIESASDRKNKLTFSAPQNFTKSQVKEYVKQKDSSPFQQVTVKALRKHVSEFCWVAPGKAFCGVKTTHGAFAYRLALRRKGDDSTKRNHLPEEGGLLFDIVVPPPRMRRRSTTAASAMVRSMSAARELKVAVARYMTDRANEFANETPKGWTLFTDCEFFDKGLREVKQVGWFNWGAKMRYMMERVQKEKQKNDHLCRNQGPVQYGQVIQLRHVKTNKFLDVRSRDGSVELADVEKECFKVELSVTGSEGSWFRFHPKFKHRQATGPVYIDDQIIAQWESDVFQRFQLHTSRTYAEGSALLDYDAHRHEVNLSSASMAINTHASIVSTPTIAVSTGGTPSPRSAQTEQAQPDTHPQTSDIGTAGYGWKLHRYRSVSAQDARDFMQIGQAVRLYHPEAEAFVCASADKGAAACPERGHKAYLQPVGMHGVRGRRSFNPEHRQNMSTKQIFVIESGEDIGFKQIGGTATWSKAFRFRHVASGKYLMIEPEKPATDSCPVPTGKCIAQILRLVHLPMGTGQGERSDDEIRKNTKFKLHPTKEGKDFGETNIPHMTDFRMQHCATGHWLGCGSQKQLNTLHVNGYGSTFDKKKPKGIKLHFSTEKSDQDSIKAFPVSPELLQSTEETLAERTCLRALSTPGPWQRQRGAEHANISILQANSRDAEQWTKAVMKTVISTLLDHRYTYHEIQVDMSVDDFWRDPIPGSTKQAAARELKIIEELFILLGSATSELSVLGELAPTAPHHLQHKQQHMRVIVDLSYKAITASFLKNNRNELYVGFRRMRKPLHAIDGDWHEALGLLQHDSATSRKQSFGERALADHDEQEVSKSFLAVLIEQVDPKALDSEPNSACSMSTAAPCAQLAAAGDHPRTRSNSTAREQLLETTPKELLITSSFLPSHEAAALCLKNLTSNNAELLQKRVGLNTIDTFVRLLKIGGPVVMFLEFLEGLASCEGEPIVVNQEHLLAALYQPSASKDDPSGTQRKENRLHMSVETTLHRSGDGEKHVVVSWQGDPTWGKEVNESALFYSASSAAMGELAVIKGVQTPTELHGYLDRIKMTKVEEALQWVWLSDLIKVVDDEAGAHLPRTSHKASKFRGADSTGSFGDLGAAMNSEQIAITNCKQISKYYQVQYPVQYTIDSIFTTFPRVAVHSRVILVCFSCATGSARFVLGNVLRPVAELRQGNRRTVPL
jgi:hypothetical protein